MSSRNKINQKGTGPQTAFWIDGFFKGAPSMRAEFEERFKDPRRATEDRFCWDYWVVPGQYRLLRTPAFGFFSEKLIQGFCEQLVEWGREVLGCHDISPPWMSAYVDGCYQKMHGDLPHGPWAFVFSLSPKRFEFKGGETFLLKDPVLQYWEQPSESFQHGIENEFLFDKIEPEFNRLTVFDPRIPHGVEKVTGVEELKDARLVIHGWFVNPRPFIRGPLSEKVLSLVIEELVEHLNEKQLERPRGCLSVGFEVSPEGRTRGLRLLTHTVRGAENDAEQILAAVGDFLSGYQWPKARPHGPKRLVTLPIVFD